MIIKFGNILVSVVYFPRERLPCRCLRDFILRIIKIYYKIQWRALWICGPYTLCTHSMFNPVNGTENSFTYKMLFIKYRKVTEASTKYQKIIVIIFVIFGGRLSYVKILI